MYTKEEYIASVLHEMRVLVHLSEKLPADLADYRPSDTQRSTTELLQYLSYIASTTAKVILEDNLSFFAPAAQESRDVTVDNFSEAMAREQQRFVEVMDSFSDEEFTKTINLFGQGEKTKGAWLVDSVVKFLAAYKMQLFLYLKTVNPTVGTSNVWGGFDLPAHTTKE